MKKGLGIGLAALLLLLPLPPGAGAANLTASGNEVDFVGQAGEANNLTIARVGDEYVFTDSGATVNAVAPCTDNNASVGRCPAAGVREIDATLNDQADTASVAASVVYPTIDDVTFFGGNGVDTLTGGPNVKNGIQGGADGDIITGGALEDSLSGQDDGDTIAGGGGDDSLRSGTDTAPDVLAGGPGDDFLNGDNPQPDGPDTFSGGPGHDRLDLRERVDNLSVNLNGVADDGAACPGAACEGDNALADLEDLETGQGDDRLTGSAARDDLDSGDGADRLLGGGNGDRLYAGDGDDVIDGGPGNDFVNGARGGDRLRGGPGDDYFEQFELFDGDPDVFNGGKGFDETGGVSGELTLQVDLDGRADDGPREAEFDGAMDNVLGSVEGLDGTAGPDVLIGNKAANELDGGGGADRLIAKGGADSVEGGRGDDVISGGKGRDLLIGAGGADEIRSRGGSPDQVSCGAAADAVRADRRDRVGADCERVQR